MLSTGSTQKTSSSFNPDELNYFICGICGKKANGTLHNHFQHAKACIQMKRHSVICLYCPQDVLPSLPGMYLDNYFHFHLCLSIRPMCFRRLAPIPAGAQITKS